MPVTGSSRAVEGSGFPKARGYFSRAPHCKDHGTLGSMSLGSIWGSYFHGFL